MAAGDVGLSSFDPEMFSSDVAYSGLADSSLGFSGDFSLESDVGLQDPLQLDTSGGETILSSYDLFGQNDPSTSLALSGVSDPPFMSAGFSTPNPGGTNLSPSTGNAVFGALSKFGSVMTSLLGGTSRAVSPSPMPLSQARIGYRPTTSVNGTTTALLIIVVVAGALLLMRRGE